MDTWMRSADGMVMSHIPAGEFLMGYEDNDAEDTPEHIVYLDAYWMDRTEVTNSMYNQCVLSGVCSISDGHYFGDTKYTNHPVVYVMWEDARTYCEWAGARLPTEAEWEKAALGVDRYIFPWGDDISCENANYRDCINSTTPVGYYKNNFSPYGLYDMIGNVWEWTADWYDNKYYVYSPKSNPLGPASGEMRVYRGGSWRSMEYSVSLAFRGANIPEYVVNYVGFRCARSATP